MIGALRKTCRPARIDRKRNQRRGRVASAMGAAWILAAVLCAAPGFAELDDHDASRERGDAQIDRYRDESSRSLRDSRRDYWERSRNGERDRDRGPRDGSRRERRLEALRHALPDFTEVERLMILRKSRRLPKAERQALRQRLRGIDDLDAAGRAALERDLRGLLVEQTDEIHRLEDNLRRWEGMSDAERERRREQMRRFRALSVEDQERLMNRWSGPESEDKKKRKRDREKKKKRD